MLYIFFYKNTIACRPLKPQWIKISSFIDVREFEIRPNSQW